MIKWSVIFEVQYIPANSVDPGQTAQRSSLISVCRLDILPEIFVTLTVRLIGPVHSFFKIFNDPKNPKYWDIGMTKSEKERSDLSLHC